MPSRSSKDHDLGTVARRVVEQAYGQAVGRTAAAGQEFWQKTRMQSRLVRKAALRMARPPAVALSPAKRVEIRKKAAKDALGA